MMGQDKVYASGQVRTMRWDLVGSSLGDSPKESGSSLGTAKGDYWEEDRRICHKIAEGCRSMWEEIVYPCISDPDGEDEGGQA
ncbi:hypothetical protein B296_00055451, partial [Ensete ventricosum]